MKKKGFFEYKCEFWDVETSEMEKIQGVVYADSYANAVYELEHYYDMIENLELHGIESCNVYEFNEGAVNFHLEVNENGEDEK